MNKKSILDAISNALLQRFETAKWAANQAHEAATSKESIAENKYDTFGLEASYLAHGQSQRVLECEEDWLSFTKANFSEGVLAISLGAFIRLVGVDSTQSTVCFFISPCAGGLTVEIENESVFLVTPSSPVGKALMGKSVDDEVDLLRNGLKTSFEVAEIL